ncbi:MAG: deoxyribose-phosphate aldolase [Pseudoalteromonas sp.]|uniref:deoxyribose-phosphate aldolase n=1 Tax=Pseudoalteromonas sp. TaxID=53249 RepID=UPI000C8F2541|nr:deoxyribose-phosphate aldolase [Pseudoalteromonas sp.]MAD05625.1 deoxyribose-phosphate aldolase [Pseudoalteromonas sp.]|tara:strand:+ start:9198 stop:9941 length:744 start_codon:yes stop_codon:yes gene_type:complete
MTKMQTSAAQAVALMDLTTLNDSDTTETINNLVASIEPKLGIPAAVCVYSQFVSDAKLALAERELQQVKVATVTNFPSGEQPLQQVINETLFAIERGADEIDLVIPYKALIAGDERKVSEYVKASKEACSNKAQLKVIIESGELSDDLISTATKLAIEGGADFVKTSTGKVTVNATLAATDTMLNTIKASGKKIGFKAAGGVRTVTDAAEYLALAESIMGEAYLQPELFRFGASGLLKDVYATLNES